jgi:heterodisulfide reductase subunit A-like polyferredoxin
MRLKPVKKQPVLPIISMEKCTLCGSCIEVCQFEALAIESTSVSLIYPEQCTYCGECEAICPEQAIACPLEVVWAN